MRQVNYLSFAGLLAAKSNLGPFELRQWRPGYRPCPNWAYDGTDYIGGDKYLETEEKVCPELLPNGFILADVVRGSRPDFGAEEADHCFRDAPDDHECTKKTDGQIDRADDPIEKRHNFVPPPLRPWEWRLPRAVANMAGK